MAEWLGMKSSTYSQCERVGKITCDQIISISEILKLDVGNLLYGEKKAVCLSILLFCYLCISFSISFAALSR